MDKWLTIYDGNTGFCTICIEGICDPTNAQNYNKYSYVLNNPLKFTDPSGYRGQQLYRNLQAPDLLAENKKLNLAREAAWQAMKGQGGGNGVYAFLSVLCSGSGGGGGGNMFGPNPTDSEPVGGDAGSGPDGGGSNGISASGDDEDPPFGISKVMLEIIFAQSFKDIVVLDIQNYNIESVDDLIFQLFSISLSAKGYDFVLYPFATMVSFSQQMNAESFIKTEYFVCPDYDVFVEQPVKTVLNPGYDFPIMTPGSYNGIDGYYYYVVQYKWRMIQ